MLTFDRFEELLQQTNKSAIIMLVVIIFFLVFTFVIFYAAKLCSQNNLCNHFYWGFFLIDITYNMLIFIDYLIRVFYKESN